MVPFLYYSGEAAFDQLVSLVLFQFLLTSAGFVPLRITDTYLLGIPEASEPCSISSEVSCFALNNPSLVTTSSAKIIH